MSERASRPVVVLPGIVTPVALSYAPTLAELEGEIEPHLKELEVYATDEPPADYSLELEVEALRRDVDEAGLETFHLVGFSGGGAVSLAFCARYAGRVRSLALFEPAAIPGPREPIENPFFDRTAEILRDTPPDETLPAFTRLHLRPGVEPPAPPAGPAPDWMAKRPAGISAILHAFEIDRTDRSALSRCRFPVYLSYGLASDGSFQQRAQILAGLFPDVWIQAHEGIHHFAPVQRSQPARFAAALRVLWERAETGAAALDSPHRDPTYAA